MALAQRMIEGGLQASDIHIFEANSKVGGLCHSKTVEGFTYDVSGGHILFSKDKETMNWMKRCAGGDDAFATRDRNTKIRFEDRWVHYPFENGLGDLPEQAKFDCLKGYIQAWHERKASDSAAPGDFKAWIAWRFGAGIAEHFMDPYNEKIWKRPLDQITSGWVAGRVPDAPIDDVLRSALGTRTEGYKHQSIFYYPKQGGFQAITDGFGALLQPNIRLNTPVTNLVRHGAGWRVNGEDFDTVVNTISMNVLPSIVEGMDAGVQQAMTGLPYNSIQCYLVALDRAEHPDLSWIYLPHASQGPANRATYMSNYSEGNAPEGKTSFLFEITIPGGQGGLGKADEEELLRGVEGAGLLRREEVLFTDHTFCKYAYIVYEHNLEARRKVSLDGCETNDIFALGRFGHYDYFNSDQCAIAATEMAQRLLERAARG